MGKSIKEIISNNISSLRKREGMTQADLADRLSYSDKSISKWERSESLPDAEMLYKLSELFHVDIQYLFTEHESFGLSIEEERRLKKKENRYHLMFAFSTFFILCTMVFSVLGSYIDLLETSNISLLLFILPLIPTILLIINLIMGHRKLVLVYVSLIIWTTAQAIYTYFIKFDLKVVFAIALILEVFFIIWPKISTFVVRKNEKKSK